MKRTHAIASRRTNDERGFVALLSVIVLGALLMASVARASLAGRQMRMRALDAEAHAQARALADGCARLALSRTLADPSYHGDTADASAEGNCTVDSVESDVPADGMMTMNVRGVVRGFYADVTVVFVPHVACEATSPLMTGLRIVSWHEVPAHD